MTSYVKTISCAYPLLVLKKHYTGRQCITQRRMLAFKGGYSVAGQLTFSRLRHMLVTAKPLLCPSSILSPSPVYTRKTTE